jgi:phosphatidylserine decarboxylase
MMKVAREGWPFIIFFAIAALLTSFTGKLWITASPVLLTLFMLYFFRDPERATPAGSDLFIAPADGRVVQIREIVEDELADEKMIEVSIFMNAFDVHVNRLPCDGTVKEVKHYPGRCMAAWSEEASKANEHITMLLDTAFGKIVVRQVAGLLARRTVCRVKPGETLKKGDRFGIIKFSSRVDLFMPLGTDIKVKLRDKVKAGESIIGVITGTKA